MRRAVPQTVMAAIVGIATAVAAGPVLLLWRLLLLLLWLCLLLLLRSQPGLLSPPLSPALFRVLQCTIKLIQLLSIGTLVDVILGPGRRRAANGFGTDWDQKADLGPVWTEKRIWDAFLSHFDPFDQVISFDAIWPILTPKKSF